MKKYLYYGVIAIALWVIIGLSIGVHNLLGKELGKGYLLSMDRDYDSLTSRNLKNLILYGVLDYDYNERYIILARVKGSGYTCKNSNKFIFEKKIQFMIIDKNSNKIISIEDEEKFLKKKSELNIELKISSYKSFKDIIQKVKESKIDIKLQECKDVNTYPITTIK